MIGSAGICEGVFAIIWKQNDAGRLEGACESLSGAIICSEGANKAIHLCTTH